MKRYILAACLSLGLSFGAAAQDVSVPGMTASGAIVGGQLLYCPTTTPADFKCTFTQVATFLFGLVSSDLTCTSGGVCTLANTAVTPGSCGDTTHSCGLTVDSKGRITAQSNNVIAGGGGGGSGTIGYKSGNYYTPYPFTKATGSAVAVNTMLCFPYVAQTTATIDTISIRTTTLASGGNSQLALYTFDATTKLPTGTAAATTGQFSVDTPLGIKTGSFTAGTGNSGSNYQVAAGSAYAICENSDNATAVFITSSTTLDYTGYLIGSPTATDILSTTGVIRWSYGTQTFGTWPNLTGVTPAGAISQAYAFPLVHITSVP